LKNLITDKEAPITKPLDTQDVQTKGVPVHVNPVTMRNTMGEASLGINMLIGPDEIKLQKKQALAQGVPVYVNPVTMRDTMGEAKLDINMKVGPDDVVLKKGDKPKALAQTEGKNPVVNPPFNNWSVNQPSPPHAKGLSGKADLG